MNASTPSTAHNAFLLAARALMALMFVPAGISKITGFEGTVGYIASVGLPMAAAGAGTRVAAVVLAVFTLAASVFFHAFWAVPADQAFVQQLMFFKNLAIVGGLLGLAAAGAGGWSVDGRR